MFRLKLFRKYAPWFFVILSGFFASLFYSSHFALREEASTLEKVMEAFYRPVATLLLFSKTSLESTYDTLLNTYQKARLYDSLQSKLEQVQILESKMDYLKRENARLRQLLRLSEKTPEKSIAVSIIGRDPTYVFDNVRINRGYKDQIQVGQGVISNKGVVGVVFRVWAHSADVLVVTDPNSYLDGLVQRNNLRVILNGRGNNQLSFKHTYSHDTTLIGDVVVTSGYVAGFPAGIPIGTVSKVLSYEDGEREVFVKTYMEIDQVSEALVIQCEDPYMSLIEQSHGKWSLTSKRESW